MHFDRLTPFIRPMLELFAVASLCGWAACLALGLSFFTPLRAITVGVGGTVVGSLLWRYLGLPVGPLVAYVPILPSLAGTFVTAFVTEVVREGRQTVQDFKAPARRSLWAARGAVAASAAASGAAAPQGAREPSMVAAPRTSSDPDDRPSAGNRSLEAR